RFCALPTRSCPVACNDVSGCEGLVRRLRGRVGMGEFRLQAVECFFLCTLFVPADQISHVFADVLVGTVLSHVGSDEVTERTAEADRHGCSACFGHSLMYCLWRCIQYS